MLKAYIFGIGILLMLSSSLAGMTWIAAAGLRRAPRRFGPFAAVAAGAATLAIVLAAVVWSVPPREVV
jgi:hypothetical protein